MYNIDTICKAALTRLFFVTFLTLLAFGPVAYAEDCTNVNRLDVNTSTERFELTGSEAEIFEVYADGPGILTFNTSAPMTASADLKLALFDNSCRPVASVDGADVIARFTSEVALWVETPGVYRFGVAVQDPSTSLDSYDTTVQFIDKVAFCKRWAFTAKTVAETEDEPDLFKTVAETEDEPDLFKTVAETEDEPDLFGVCFAKTVAETEDEPDLFKTVAETEDEPDLFKTVAETEDEPDLLQVALSSFSLMSADDHADAFFFATHLVLGSEANANLDQSHADADVFTFSIPERNTIQVELLAGIDLLGQLYDRNGQILDAFGLKSIKTLGPGRYYVKVGHSRNVDESYRLSVTIVGW